MRGPADTPAAPAPDPPGTGPVVLGVGASRGCPPPELAALVREALAEAGLTVADVAVVASADVKADEPAVLALAGALGVPTRFLPAGLLRTVTVPTPSAVVAAHVGTPSVSEASALLVAGERAGDGGRGELLVTKRRSARATCAVAAPVAAADRRPRTVVTATEECRGCGGCLRTCPEHALVPVGALRADGTLGPSAVAGGIPLLTLTDRCTGCGECLEICPVDAFIEVTLP